MVVVALIAVVVALVVVRRGAASDPAAGISTPVRAKIVTVAESQLGYQTDPTHSYCNKYSAYWGEGSSCGHGLRAEEWCADFAAWVWRMAGAPFTYSFGTGDINSGAISFYRWAVAHGTWHPYGEGYTPQPGDVAVYGLTVTGGTAAHVAVVTAAVPGHRGPDVVNGDGDRGAYSIVQAGTAQYKADAPGSPAVLAGYASPLITPPAATPG